MHERLIWFPFCFSGTTATNGTAFFVVPFPCSFHSGAIATENGNGGTVRVRYAGTAQGTASLRTETSTNGSIYVGTAATTSGTQLPGGTVPHLHIPANGTIWITGTATVNTIMSGYAAFLIDEFGGTAYVGT